MKKNTSITVDAEVMKQIDHYAKRKKLNRSEAIERLCAEALRAADGSAGYVEFVRLTALPSQVRDVLGSFLQHDKDGPVEAILRVTKKRWVERFGPLPEQL